MWLRKLWRRFFVREILVPVPMEIPKAENKPGEDPAHLRDIADSFRKCHAVYRNLNEMIKRRREILDLPPPTTNQADRDSLKWRKDQAAIEVAILSEVFMAPQNATRALNALANHKKAIEVEDHSNWSLERNA